MFEDDGIKIVREVEPSHEYRGKYEKKKKGKISPVRDPDQNRMGRRTGRVAIHSYFQLTSFVYPLEGHPEPL